jgi:3-dehydroquinate dehydratase-1
MQGNRNRPSSGGRITRISGQKIKWLRTWSKPPAVVGIVDSKAALKASRRGASDFCDFFEWRADRMGSALPESPLPWILTVRHSAEGGGHLSTGERKKLFLELLPFVSHIDLEVRSLGSMQEVVGRARELEIPIIASFHDFKKTPRSDVILKKIRTAKDLGASIAKVACQSERPADLVRLLFVLEKSSLPLSIMGMGKLGMASRVLFAGCGSVLNYGWLHGPNVEGQWCARQLSTIVNKMVLH